MPVLNDKRLQEKIQFTPFEAQEQVIQAFSKNRDIRLAAGTRFGKSKLCAYLALKEVLKDNKRIWIVAPTYDLAEKVFAHLTEFIAEGFPSLMKNVYRKPNPHIETPWGSWIRCKSADSPESLLGEELDLVIMDECSRIPEEIWMSFVRQRLTSRKGKSVFISTPRGQNWFYREWLRCKDSEDGKSFRFSSIDGMMPKDEFERERKITPKKIFQQECEAVFLAESAGVFGNIRDCIRGQRMDYVPTHLYTLGVDLGRHEDFTVVTVVDRMTNSVVDFHRFNEIDWAYQKRKIIEVAEKYGHPLIYIDATSATVGDAFVDELSNAGYSTIGYKIGGNTSKRQLIEKLSVLIDNMQLHFPDIEELIAELEVFTYEIMPNTGIIKYHAPQGLHDDCVVSLALAVWDLDSDPLQELDSPDLGNALILNKNQEF